MTDFKQDKNTEIFQAAVQKLGLRFPNKTISEATGYDKGNISNFLKGKKPISDEFLDKFLTTFNLDKKEISISEAVILEPQSSYKTIPNQLIVNVPYYDVDFAGGWSSENLFVEQQPSFYINAPEFDKADFACNLFGNSISNRITNRSVIGLREIKDWQIYFNENELHAVIMNNDLRTVKIVKRSKSNKDFLQLIPDPKPEHNATGYETQEVPVNFVRKFFEVVAYACYERIAM